MLYKVNDYQWVSLKTVENIMVKQGVNGKWYLELTTGTGSTYTDDFESEDKARMEVLKIHKMMEDYLV